MLLCFSLWCFKPLCFYVTYYLQCVLMGTCQAGSCLWSTAGGAVTCMISVCPGWGGLCGGTPCSLGPRFLSVWLAPPKGSFLPASGLTSQPCLLVTASVCVGVSVSLYVFVYVSVHVCGGGRVGFF